MNRALVATLLVGCASGTNSLVGNDSAIQPQADAPSSIDAHVSIDARRSIDARPIDAEPIDAAKPIDAEPIDACVPVETQLLANPVLDLAPAGTLWTQVPIDPMYPPITSDGAFAAQSTPYKAWMGGIAGQDEGLDSVTDFVYQDVAVPTGTTKLELTFYYASGTNETDLTFPYDTSDLALLQTDGTLIEDVLSQSSEVTVGTWTHVDHVFTALPAGQTVRLQMTSTNDITNASNFFFDTFALTATHCP